jgi:hypothetical protein
MTVGSALVQLGPRDASQSSNRCPFRFYLSTNSKPQAMPSRLGVAYSGPTEWLCKVSRGACYFPETAHSGSECVPFWPEKVHFWFFRAKWDNFSIGVSGLRS